MANKDKQGKKGKDKKIAVPTPKKSEKKRKPCKSPRGVKLVKGMDVLLGAVEKPIPRKRNSYNEHMAQVKRLANLVMRVG